MTFGIGNNSPFGKYVLEKPSGEQECVNTNKIIIKQNKRK